MRRRIDPNTAAGAADEAVDEPMAEAACAGAAEDGAGESFEGASPNERLVGGAKTDDMATLRQALADGAQINTVDGAKNSALHYAAMRGNVEILTALLAVPGIAVNKRNFEGDEPLSLASYNGWYDAVLLLLQAGARTDTANKHGESPADVAATDEIYELIQQAIVASTLAASGFAGADEVDDEGSGDEGEGEPDAP